MAAGLVLFVPLGLAACGGDSSEDGGGSAAEQSAAPEPTTLSITTSDLGEGRFNTEAPGSIKGGLVKVVFKNAGMMPHEAQLIRVDEGHTVAEAVEIIDSEDDKTPEWLRGAGGVALTPPGQQGTTFINLPAGNYGVISLGAGGPEEGPSPATRGALAEFEVTPGEPGELPQTSASIVAEDDGEHGEAGDAGGDEDAEEHEHGFEATGLKPGRNTILFDNRSDELHHAVMVPILGDTTLEEVEEALASEGPPEGPPPVDFENIVITSVLDGKTKEVTEMELRAGRYALLCFISDREGGKPHVAEGMLEEVMVG
jgi:hypothetical protein